jgi:hypothetical protein
MIKKETVSQNLMYVFQKIYTRGFLIYLAVYSTQLCSMIMYVCIHTHVQMLNHLPKTLRNEKEINFF